MGSSAEFDDRLRELAERVGDGHIEMEVEVDQVYAHYQHEGLDLRHPRGGQARYLGAPLLANAHRYCDEIARRVLDEGALPPMRDNARHLAGEVGRLAPLDFNNLRRSAHPMVHDRGETVWQEGPEQPRLSEEELKALRRNRGE